MQNIPFLFKYKSLNADGFKYAQDIFINRRIYLPKASDLNDPNEGVAEIQIKNMYRYWGNQIEERNRSSTRIFSLTENNKSALMWSHYADNQKGICIKFNLEWFANDKTKILGAVKYLSEPIKVPHNEMSNHFNIFLNKESSWQYEKEWRIISTNENRFITIPKNTIQAIYLGPRFDNSNLEWVQYWANYCGSNSPIPIIKMAYASTQYELFEENELLGKIPRLS